ncbi:MAG: hypothetical protein KC593_13415 [Myxococcales bacterium]|nr:hypothetical protein [Myxococcales bacterium]
MRSRPDLRLYLTPRQPTAGARLSARIQLQSRTHTPYDGIEVRLVGRENRYERSTSDGNSTSARYHRREILRLAAEFRGGVLEPGTLEREVTFELPQDAPPTFRSTLASIAYELEVRVRIPWWPDRRGRFVVTMHTPATDPGPPRPKLFTTERSENRGDDPVLELSLEDDRLVLGGALAGAVAITGLGGKRLRRVEVACVALETALVRSTAGAREADRRTWVVHQGTPREGAALPFHIAIPPELPPSFQSPFIRVTHFVEAKAVVALGRDITLRVPVVAARAERARTAAPVPLVGNARQATVWQAALERMQERPGGVEGLHFDAERGSASFTRDGVLITVAEEDGEVRRRPRRGLLGDRSGGGPCLVAELSWPALGLDLRVAERRWTDFGERHAALDETLQRRFTVRVREPAQAAPFLNPALRDSLSSFDEAGLDDERAVVLRRGGVYQVEGLVRFLTQLHGLAGQVARAGHDIPPPAALAAEAAAWEAVASARGARLRPGDLALVDWALRGVPLALTHRWEGQRLVGSELSTPLPVEADADAWRDALAEATGAGSFVEGGRVGVVFPELLRPEAVLRVAEAFSLAVASLLGSDVGPYR